MLFAALMRYIFKWSGEPLGFVDDGGELFDTFGRHLGRVDSEGNAWCNDGQYLGEFIDGHYILRNALRLPLPPKLPEVPLPKPSELPPPVAARTPRAPIPGWVDSFDSIPERPELVATISAPTREALHPVAHRGKDGAPGAKA